MKVMHEMLFWLKLVFLGYAISAILLAILAFAALKAELDNKYIMGAIVVIYFISTLVTGIMCGKLKKSKRLIYGTITGGLYITILICMSLAFGKNAFDGAELPVALIAAIAGGMVGGVIS